MRIEKIVLYTTVFLCLSCKESKEKKPDFIIPAPTVMEKILSRGTLEISTFYSTTDYYIYKGITRGFHYDLAKDFADFLGVQLSIIEVNNDIDSAINKLGKGTFDLLAVSLTETPERKQNINFSLPLFETGEVLIQNKKNEIVRNIADLSGREIFIKKNAPVKKKLTELADSLNITFTLSEVSTYSSEDLLHLVDIGEIDYAITDENIARALSISMKNLDYSLLLDRNISVSWAVNPSSVHLAEELDTWLLQVKNSGKLNALYHRYFNNPNSVPHLKSKYAILKKGDISPFDQILKKESKQLGWDWRLLAAIMYCESKFDPEAESQLGAYGLMQVIPETANMFNVFDYFTPDSNIYVSAKYLKYLDNFFTQYPITPEEKIKFTIASYNVGPGHVMDAMRLAQKYEKDPYIWDKNVDFYLRNKSNPEYYRDSLSRNGYCNGQQAYEYVHKVLETYNNYKHIKN